MESDYTAMSIGYESADDYLAGPRPEHRNLETFDLIFAARPPLAVTAKGNRLLRDWADAGHLDLERRAAAVDALWDDDWMADDTHLTLEASILLFDTLDRLEAASR